MAAFLTLYRFELKKLLQKRSIWVTVILCLIAFSSSILIGAQGDFYVNGERYCTAGEMISLTRQHELALSGRSIDQQLLEETCDAYKNYLSLLEQAGSMPSDNQLRELTDVYMEEAKPYQAIFNFIESAAGMDQEDIHTWTPDEKQLYEAVEKRIISNLEANNLTSEEIDFWSRKWNQVEKPLVYSRTESYDFLLTMMYTFGVFLIIFIAVCLSGIFPEEHTRRTDQLILCSAYGKNSLYWAKLLAGVSFACAATLGMCMVVFVMFFGVYGIDGFHAPLQLIMPEYPYPLTVGQALLIAYGIVLVTAVICSVGVMVLSELLKSNIAALALTVGLLLVGMLVNIPEQYRIISQIWDWLPHCIMAVWNVFDLRLLPIFGHYFTAWQALPVIYLLASILVAIIGKPIYHKFQVAGR